MSAVWGEDCEVESGGAGNTYLSEVSGEGGFGGWSGWFVGEGWCEGWLAGREGGGGRRKNGR